MQADEPAVAPDPRPGIFLLRNPTVADVVDVLSRWFTPDQAFLSSSSVFTEVGFEQSWDADGSPFVVLSVLGKPMGSIITMPGEKQAVADHDLLIRLGDCEFQGDCTCGQLLGFIKPTESLDVLGQLWEKHVMAVRA